MVSHWHWLLLRGNRQADITHYAEATVDNIRITKEAMRGSLF